MDFFAKIVEAVCRVASFLFTSSFRVNAMSHSRLNSASELVQQAPKEISGRVSDLYDVVSQAVGKEKERVAQKMSQIGDGAREAVKKLPWQVSEKGGGQPLNRFRMAARRSLYLRQQSKLDLNEHIQK